MNYKMSLIIGVPENQMKEKEPKALIEKMT